MILSDREIKKAVEEGRIIVKPEPNWEKQLGSCSLDLRLGEETKSKRVVYLTGDRRSSKSLFSLKPGEFALGVTWEYLEFPPDICGMLHGRSSLGRKGLMIHSTAPLIDAGFRGKIVLEFYNAGPEPIKLEPGMRVCSVSFERLSTPAQVPYFKKKNAQFLGQERP